MLLAPSKVEGDNSFARAEWDRTTCLGGKVQPLRGPPTYEALCHFVEPKLTLQRSRTKSTFLGNFSEKCYAPRSPRFSLRASSAARSEALAPVYLSIMSWLDQPATAMSPNSEPPARTQRVAVVCRIMWRWKRSMPAEVARSFSALLRP